MPSNITPEQQEAGLAHLTTHLSTAGSKPSAKRQILILYTGGTFGCDVVKDPKTGKAALDPMQGRDFYKRLKVEVPLLATMEQDDPKVDPSSRPDSQFWFWAPPKTIDSTNATPEFWGLVARTIEVRANKYDGFVVIQGTDTLYYTAAALSFLLVGTMRPVVVTGAQTPLIAPVSDASMNLIGALRACLDVPANTSTKPDPAMPKQIVGVFLFFNHKLMNATRCMKVDSHNYNAFVSPNMGVVAHAQPILIPVTQSHVYDMAVVKRLYDDNATMHQRRVKHLERGCPSDHEYQSPREGDQLDDGHVSTIPIYFNTQYQNWLNAPSKDSHLDVRFLRLAPGVQLNIPALYDAHKNCDAIIVESYGAGNAPYTPEKAEKANDTVQQPTEPKKCNSIVKMLEDLRNEENIPVAIITECNYSGVGSPYGVAVPRSAGALCQDMTPGCAYTRMYLATYMMSFLSTNPAYRRDRVEQIMVAPMLLCFTPPEDNFLRDRLVSMNL